MAVAESEVTERGMAETVNPAAAGEEVYLFIDQRRDPINITRSPLPKNMA